LAFGDDVPANDVEQKNPSRKKAAESFSTTESTFEPRRNFRRTRDAKEQSTVGCVNQGMPLFG
jgi:hypothetical protein